MGYIYQLLVPHCCHATYLSCAIPYKGMTFHVIIRCNFWCVHLDGLSTIHNIIFENKKSSSWPVLTTERNECMMLASDCKWSHKVISSFHPVTIGRTLFLMTATLMTIQVVERRALACFRWRRSLLLKALVLLVKMRKLGSPFWYCLLDAC